MGVCETDMQRSTSDAPVSMSSLVGCDLEVRRPRAIDARASERGLGLPLGGLGPPPAALRRGPARLSGQYRSDPATDDGNGGSGLTLPYRMHRAVQCGRIGAGTPVTPRAGRARGVAPRFRWGRVERADHGGRASAGRDPPASAAARFRGGRRRWHTRYVPSTIRATCVACGTIEIPVSDGRLVVSMHGDDVANVVEFMCPRCGLAGSQSVDERGTRLLAAAGIEVVASPPVAAPVPEAGPVEADGIGADPT